MSLSDPDSPERQEYVVRHRRRKAAAVGRKKKKAECCINFGAPLNAALQCDRCRDAINVKVRFNSKFKQLLLLKDWFSETLDIRIFPLEMQLPLTRLNQLRLQEIVEGQESSPS